MMDLERSIYIIKKSKEWNKLEKYLKDFDEFKPPNINDIWRIADQVWDDMGFDNKDYNLEQLSKYYSHPSWFFSENKFLRSFKGEYKLIEEFEALGKHKANIPSRYKGFIFRRKNVK